MACPNKLLGGVAYRSNKKRQQFRDTLQTEGRVCMIATKATIARSVTVQEYLGVDVKVMPNSDSVIPVA